MQYTFDQCHYGTAKQGFGWEDGYCVNCGDSMKVAYLWRGLRWHGGELG
jgi:hypothetical protein